MMLIEQDHTEQTYSEQAATPPAVIEGLQRIAPICEVLGAQLEHVVQETETASSTFIVQLTAIDTEVTTLTDKIGRLDAQISQNTEIQQLAARNAQIISELTQTVKNRDITIRSAIQEVSELDAQADAISEIAHTINILGLNALIVAATAGEEGAAFGVVAREVRALSGKSDASAAGIRGGINALTLKMNAALRGAGENTSVDLDAQLAQITDMQATLEQQFASVTLGAAAIVDEVKHTAAQLASLTIEAMSAVQFQDLVRQIVEQVQTSLARLVEHARALASVDGKVGTAKLELLRNDLDLADIKTSYVMQRQRETHGHVTATAIAADSGPAIQLF